MTSQQNTIPSDFCPYSNLKVLERFSSSSLKLSFLDFLKFIDADAGMNSYTVLLYGSVITNQNSNSDGYFTTIYCE